MCRYGHEIILIKFYLKFLSRYFLKILRWPCIFSDVPQPSLRLLTPWTDVFEDESLAFTCEVDGSDWTFTWYKNEGQLQEDSVMVLDAEEPYLNITSITQAYHGGYACQVHFESRVRSGFSNTVNVTVYGEHSHF